MTTKTYYSDRDEWLQLRRTLNKQGCFGGSDMGSITGISPWKSPYAFWAEATDKVAVDENTFTPQARERMRQGRDLEEYVAQRFCEIAGKKCHQVNAIIQSDRHPRLFATIDRKISGESAGLECKRMSDLRANTLTVDEMPSEYYAQCVHYLACTELTTWYLCIMSSDSIHIYAISRDKGLPKPEWCKSITYVTDEEFEALDKAAEWMASLIETDTPPPVDGSNSTSEAIATQFGAEDTIPFLLDATPIEEVLQERANLKAQADEIKAKLAECENNIKVFLGQAEGALTATYKVTWKPQTRKSLDADAIAQHFDGRIPEEFYKETTSRTLRITTNKK